MRTEAQILRQIMKLKDELPKLDSYGMDSYDEAQQVRAQIRQLEWVLKEREEE